jgi:hypothetical protein
LGTPAGRQALPVLSIPPNVQPSKKYTISIGKKLKWTNYLTMHRVQQVVTVHPDLGGGVEEAWL